MKYNLDRLESQQMKCEGVGPGDDDVDRRKLGLKYLKSSSKPHLNLIVNLSRWCCRKSPKILSHDHGHEVEIVFVFCLFFFPKTKVLLSFGLDNVFGQFCAAIYKMNLLSCEFSDGEYNKDIDQFITQIKTYCRSIR